VLCAAVFAGLPPPQQALLKAVLALKKPVVLVLIHGGAMSIGDEVKSGAAAIVDAFYGGEVASQAMADVMFGVFNPTGVRRRGGARTRRRGHRLIDAARGGPGDHYASPEMLLWTVDP